MGFLISFLSTCGPRIFSEVSHDVLMALPVSSADVFNYLSVWSKETGVTLSAEHSLSRMVYRETGSNSRSTMGEKEEKALVELGVVP